MPYNFRCEIDYDFLAAAFIDIFDNNCCRRLTSTIQGFPSGSLIVIVLLTYLLILS